MSRIRMFVCRFALSVALLLSAFSLPLFAADGDRYRLWAEKRFGGATLADPSQETQRWGPYADPDGDGLNNLLEYALDLDPLSPSLQPTPIQVPIPWLTGDQSAFVLSATIRTDDPELIVFPQISLDNSTWLPFALDRSDLGDGDHFYTVKVDEAVPYFGVKQVTWAARPTGTGWEPHFMRLTAIRQSDIAHLPSTESARTLPGSTAPRVSALASTPSIPGLAFTGQLHAAPGAELVSNTVTLRGFKGNIEVTAPSGVMLIVNGKAIAGQAALVRASDTLALRAKAPARVAAAPTTYSLKVGGSATADWTVASQQAAALAVPAGTVSGYTPVSAGVGPSGDANITIPITCSPGVGGIEPKLSISYSSNSGNGLLGIGFNLGGLSAISRTSPNLYQDGKRGPIRYDTDDRFAVDGARLISVTGADGADGTVYRTEIDNFSRIRSFGQTGNGPARWVVETKAGLTYEYGADTQSRVVPQGKISVLVWALTKVRDSLGNEMRFTYVQENGSYRISAIDYTFDSSGANLTTNRIDFTYGDRADKRTIYAAGAKIVSDKRLTEIHSTHNSQTVRKYALAYDSMIADDSRLISVQEFGADGTAFRPTLFQWPAVEPTAYLTTSTDAGFTIYDRATPNFIGDFNGDGKTDYLNWHTPLLNSRYNLILATPNGFAPAVATEINPDNALPLIVADFNGDGKTDVMTFASATERFALHLSTGNGFGPNIATPVPNFSDAYRQVTPGDFNGDGRTDLLVWNPQRLRFDLYLANAASFDPAIATNVFVDGSSSYTGELLFVGEYNGDGMADLLITNITTGKYSVLYSTGNGFSTPAPTDVTNFANAYSPNIVGDYNGDGLTDILAYDNPKTTTGHYILYLCTGAGFAPPIPTEIQGGNDGRAIKYRESVDFNGDGRMDMATWHSPFANFRLNIWISTGTGFKPAVATSIDRWDLLTEPGDFNGDGKTDMLVYHTPISYEMNRFINVGPVAPLLQRVTNGHECVVAFTYRPMTDSTVYTKQITATYPAFNFQASVYTVNAMEVQTGVDGDPDAGATGASGTRRMTYSYEDVQLYLDGRGYQQAKVVTESDEATGIVTKTFFGTKADNGRDITQLSGYPVKVEQRLGSNGPLISTTENTWIRQTRNDVANHKVYFAFATSSVKKEYEISTGSLVRTTTSTTPTNGYDSHGNLLTSSTTVTDGSRTYKETTVNTYSDTVTDTKWFLGRLATSTVTKQAPGVPTVTRTSSFAYNATTGLLGIERIEPNDLKLRIDKVYLRDRFGNITDSSETAWNGAGAPALDQTRSKHTDYSSDGRFITKTVNALGHAETTVHEPLYGRVTSQTGPNQVTTSWEFDGFGRPLREVRADGTETTSSYLRATPGQSGAPARAVHCVITQSTEAPTQTVWFDILDREIQRDTVGFDGRTVSSRKVYNARGEVVQASQPFFAGNTPRYAVMTYDSVGRVLTETEPGDRITKTAYNGLTTTVTNPKGQILKRSVTPVGKLDVATDANLRPLSYLHDAFGNLIKVTDSKTNVTTLTCDRRGNKTSMVEPNTGKTNYEYNGFGELIAQTNSSNQRTTYSYDLLGRLLKRVEPDGTSTWIYDNFPNPPPDSPQAGHSIGKLVRAEKADFREDHFYDFLGRPNETRTTIKTEIFSTSTTYDFAGRVETLTYPTGFATRNVYTDLGHLAQVQHAVSGLAYWKAVTVNSRGQVETETLGNGLQTRRTFVPETGRLLFLQTDRGGSQLADIQNLSFDFDAIGNLAGRRDRARGILERFDYDKLNRLTEATITGGASDFPTVNVSFDELGNPRSRTDSGTLNYTNPAPHAVTGLTGRPGGAPDLRYTYDARGNRTKTEHRTGTTWVTDLNIGYSTANLPTLLTTPNPSAGSTTVTTTFDYGPNRARYRQIQQNGGAIYFGRLYIGGLYEREKRFASGALTATRHVHYIAAGSGTVAIQQMEEGSGAAFAERTLYVHKDHLGSVESLTDQTGALKEHLSYDAWGRRRNTTLNNGTYNLSYKASSPLIAINTARGFTGHEMLDAFGLVHMNGRLYDPLNGRFLSADPVVQELDNLQNLNRYSYVLNNPLSLTDPSGFSFFGKIGKFFAKHWQTIVQVASFALHFIPGIGTALALGIQAGLSFGSAFTGTLLAGGSVGDAFRAGFVSGASSLLTGGTPGGSGFSGAFFNAIANGVVQGGLSAAAGGNFSHGFFSGAFRGAVGGFAGGIQGFEGAGPLRTAISAIEGGTASAIGGGKFANGAVTGAMAGALGGAGGEAGGSSGRDHAADMSLNDISHFIGFVANLPIAIPIWAAGQLFPETIGRSLLVNSNSRLATLWGTEDHDGWGVIVGNNVDYRIGGAPGLFGVSMMMVHAERVWGYRGSFEEGMLAHDNNFGVGADSEGAKSIGATFGQGVGIFLKHLGVPAGARNIFGQSADGYDFVQGYRNGLTPNLPIFSERGHN